MTIPPPNVAYERRVRLEPPPGTATEADLLRPENRLVWEVEPELRLVRVHTDATTFTTVALDQTLAGEPVLPGFDLPLRELYAALEPPTGGTQP